MKFFAAFTVLCATLACLTVFMSNAEATMAVAPCGARSSATNSDAETKVKFAGGGYRIGTVAESETTTAASPDCYGSYRYEPLCGKGQTGGVCGFVAMCGNDGVLKHVYYTPPGGVEEARGLQCIEDGVATPAITQRIVLRALKRITLPKPKMIVQPPGGKTLVNFDTLFHTEADTINRTIRLLGKRIDLEITPASYTWHHGDHTTQSTTTPGIAYDSETPMDSYISHRYADAHVTVHPSVDVSYTARFRVGHGPWRPVNGTVTRTGPPVDLRIIEGRTVLLGR